MVNWVHYPVARVLSVFPELLIGYLLGNRACWEICLCKSGKVYRNIILQSIAGKVCTSEFICKFKMKSYLLENSCLRVIIIVFNSPFFCINLDAYQSYQGVTKFFALKCVSTLCVLTIETEGKKCRVRSKSLLCSWCDHLSEHRERIIFKDHQFITTQEYIYILFFRLLTSLITPSTVL